MELINANVLNDVASNGKGWIFPSPYSVGADGKYYGAYFYQNSNQVSNKYGGCIVLSSRKHLNAEDFKPKRYGTN